MDAAARDTQRLLPVRGLAVVAAGLVAIDIVRLIVLPGQTRAPFTNGFEVVVAGLVFLAAAGAAARTGGGERSMWWLVAAHFVLLSVAALHDLIITMWGLGLPGLGTLELLGWLAYLPLAFLCVAPVGGGNGSSGRKAVPLLDFLQATLVLSVAYYAYVYTPHVVAQTTWETVGRPEMIRNVVICAALLGRAVGDPRARARTVFGWVAAMYLARTLFQTALFAGWTDAAGVVGRPLSFMVFAIFATQWRGPAARMKPEPYSGWREVATKWMLGVLSAAAPVFLAVVAERRPQGEVLMWPVFALSLVAFVSRTGVAEYERLTAARLREAEEEALAESEAKLRAVMDTSFGGGGDARCRSPCHLRQAVSREVYRIRARRDHADHRHVRVGLCTSRRSSAHPRQVS
jgi:hypothetical protein